LGSDIRADGRTVTLNRKEVDVKKAFEPQPTANRETEIVLGLAFLEREARAARLSDLAQVIRNSTHKYLAADSEHTHGESDPR